MTRRTPGASGKAPFLRRIGSVSERVKAGSFPFTIPAFRGGIDVELSHPVTLFVGENGSGKSTLLEAIASSAGFSLESGTRQHTYGTRREDSELAKALRLSWFPKVTDGFFLRAESFFNFASYVDDIGREDPRIYASYGGKSLHERSHGEGFLTLFQERFRRGLFLLDEPEAALSPQRQLAFLRIMHDLTTAGEGQFVIATHSPILTAFPRATILSFDGDAITQVAYEDVPHVRLMRQFLESPERIFRHLFS